MAALVSQKSKNTLISELVLLLVPTFFMAFFLLWQASFHSIIFKDSYRSLAIILGIGMIISLFIHHTRLRFLPIFLILLGAGLLMSYILSNIYVGELDVFIIAHKFSLHFLFFCIGWLIAYGFVRLSFWSVIISIIATIASIFLISVQVDYFDPNQGVFGLWMKMLIPVALFSVFIIFMNAQINQQRKTGRFLLGRTTINGLLFLLIAMIVFGGIIYFTKNDLENTLANYGGGKQSNDGGSILKNNKDGSVSLNDKTSLGGSNSNRSNELVFAAYIDNFLEDGETPNPLYMTAFYYAHYDIETETFERAHDMPDDDLLEARPNRIPIYNTYTDSSVLLFGRKDKLKRTVEYEVYNKKLSDSVFLGPTTAFFVQPIAVDPAFQKEYKSAYRAKSSVSELNSAYFVYNVNHPVIKEFQNQRFAVLRNVRDFSAMDRNVFNYYTQYPNAENLQPIKDLAYKITLGKTAPIDKIIAIRDYFLAKDEKGNKTFTYSDNPGIPDIPSASKLTYFLFDSKNGYCAHYSGATLLMLRSLGIPSRITVGFLTQDRSSNNKGWYYYYADQAHAWVQVYFPGFGWLDFDTTVGNDEARESNQPDATPPLQPSKAVLAINGIVQSIDTFKKTIQVKTGNIVYMDKTFQQKDYIDLSEDVSQASFYNDTLQIDISKIKKGDTIAAISYDRNIIKSKSNFSTLSDVAKALTQPVSIDQIVLNYQKSAKAQAQKKEIKETPSSWKWIGIELGVLLLLLLLLFPRLLKWYWERKARNAKNIQQKYYYYYLASNYQLWMNGNERNEETPIAFAQRVDHNLGLNYSPFIYAYTNNKYGNGMKQKMDEELDDFYSSFSNKIKALPKEKKKKGKWWNINRSIAFLRKEK